MIFIISTNCSCGQPIISTPIEARRTQDIDLSATADRLLGELRASILNGSLALYCPTCRMGLHKLETVIFATHYLTIAEANEDLEKAAQGVSEGTRGVAVYTQ